MKMKDLPSASSQPFFPFSRVRAHMRNSESVKNLTITTSLTQLSMESWSSCHASLFISKKAQIIQV